MTPLVAIIMRSKNEMPHLRAALTSLTNQSFDAFELFVTDSGSSDGSIEILREYCKAEHLTQIPAEEYAPGKVLNEAVARITQPIVVLLNADAIPLSKTWLEQLVDPIISNEADATFSKQVARPDADFMVSYDYQRAYDPEKSTEESFSAVACAFKRELWERHKFQNQHYAEDHIWASACTTFGARLRFIPESEVEHSHNYSLTQLYYKKFRHGFALATTVGIVSLLRHRLYLCFRELVRDFIFTCQEKQFRTLPYNIAYRITIHAGLYRGIKAGSFK